MNHEQKERAADEAQKGGSNKRKYAGRKDTYAAAEQYVQDHGLRENGGTGSDA